jgi:hypothetical protein
MCAWIVYRQKPDAPTSYFEIFQLGWHKSKLTRAKLVAKHGAFGKIGR